MAHTKEMLSITDANPSPPETTERDRILCDINDIETMKRSLKCLKYGAHSSVFTKFEVFRVENLPKDQRKMPILSAVKVIGLLVVRINGFEKRESQPEVSLFTKVGSGIIVDVTFLDAGNKAPRNNIVIVRIKTAKRFLSGIRQATATFHDENGNQRVLYWHREVESDVEHGETIAEFWTDDVALGCIISKVLRRKAILAHDLSCSPLKRHLNAAIVISYLHGGFKCVSVGKIRKQEQVDAPYQLYGHDAPTCSGCTGAAVWLLGIPSPTEEDFCHGILTNQDE